jgi:hypothetical protein
MTDPSLPAALRAAAEGLYALEAATGLIIAHGTWLERDDFACYIHPQSLHGGNRLGSRHHRPGRRTWSAPDDRETGRPVRGL